ncbi:MAG: S41 family peptidase [Chitinispirillia bacterium]|jgi:carboxyl-terminal processing protease
MNIKGEDMKYAGIAFLCGAVLLFSLLSCEFSGHDSDLSAQKYEFAAELLNAHFIFPERLPATVKDFYSFPSPEALYESVHEPYTVYFNSENAANLLSGYLSTESYGIGIRMEYVDRGYLIRNVFPDSPGEKAGLMPMDTILMVNGVSVQGMDLTEFKAILSGENNSTVVLSVKRGSDQINITVARGPFKTPTVFVEVVDSSVVSIKLTNFFLETNTPGGSAAEFAAVLDSTEWAEYIILDLRMNGGGLLGQCFDIVGMLVPPETEIITTRERQYNPETNESFITDRTYLAEGTGIAADRTIYVLVDSYTASASEILVSCIMQRPKVTVIGEVTFGKARGQIYSWGPDSVFAKVTFMTITPIGDSAVSYDSVGIIPDALATSEEAFDVALDIIYDTAVSAKRTVIPRKSRRLWCDVPLHHIEPKALLPAWEW